MNESSRAAQPAGERNVDRRTFVVTSLGAGFAARRAAGVGADDHAPRPTGLVAGEVKVPAKDGEMPAYRAMPATGGNFPVDPRRAGDLRRARAHQGRLPPPREGRLLRDRAGALRAPGRRRRSAPTVQALLAKIVAKVPDAQVMARPRRHASPAPRASGKADTARARHHRLLLGRPHRLACTPRTTRT